MISTCWSNSISSLRKVCASTAWVGGLLAAHQWLIAGFSEAAQRDVWDGNPDAVACGSYAPAAKAIEVEGGYRLTGRWSFASGCDNAQWSLCAALLPSKTEGGPFAPAFLLVPASDYLIDDTWNVVGLGGTGSKTLVLNDVFVPEHRVLSFADTTSGKTPGAALYAENPTFSIPMLSNIPSCLASAAVGAAAGALEDYLDVTCRRITRGAVAGNNNRMAEFPTIQLRVAEAARLGGCRARNAAARSAGIARRRSARDRPVSIEDRIVSRRGQAFSVVAGDPRQRSAERLDRRARARSFQSGAARLARRQCRRPPHQHELGRRRHHVRPARARAAAARPILRPIQSTSDISEDDMQGKIALEEHFAIPETLMDSAGFVPECYWPELKERLLDIQDKRLRQMDEHGVEMMILSLNAPAVQAIPDVKKANEIAIRANDYPGRTGRKTSRPLSGLCGAADAGSGSRDHQNSSAAVKTLGFRGALVNGFSQVGDGKNAALLRPAAILAVLGGKVEKLDVPFYLHPRNPLPEDCAIYEGHPWLMGPTWAFGQETAVHALRLMGSGLFDAPSATARSFSATWAKACPTACGASTIATAGSRRRRRYKAKKKICEYFNAQLLPDHVGQFPHPDADRCHARDRRGPHPVLGRLAVRERRSRRRLVRQRQHQRGRPHQDRTTTTRIDLFKLDSAKHVAGHRHPSSRGIAAASHHDINHHREGYNHDCDK